MLENTYEVCRKHELERRGLKTEQQVGLLINFNVVRLRDDVKRMVNNLG